MRAARRGRALCGSRPRATPPPNLPRSTTTVRAATVPGFTCTQRQWMGRREHAAHVREPVCHRALLRLLLLLLLYTVTLPLSNVPAFLLQRLEQGRSPGLSRVASRFPLGMIAPNSRRSGCRVKLQRRRCHSTDDRFIASAYMYKCTQSTLHSKIFLLPTY